MELWFREKHKFQSCSLFIVNRCKVHLLVAKEHIIKNNLLYFSASRTNMFILRSSLLAACRYYEGSKIFFFWEGALNIHSYSKRFKKQFDCWQTSFFITNIVCRWLMKLDNVSGKMTVIIFDECNNYSFYKYK